MSIYITSGLVNVSNQFKLLKNQQIKNRIVNFKMEYKIYLKYGTNE